MPNARRVSIAWWLALGVWLASTVTACGDDPATTAARGYADEVNAAFADNLALSQTFLDLASKLKRGESDGAAVAALMTQDLLPRAQKLEAAAGRIQPADPALGDLHAKLRHAWSERAAAYAAMADAWAANDVAAFDAARKRNLQSKVEEEAFVREANAWLAPHGTALDQFPGAG
jgi:hypothetical protein